jgi:hypothetical protein
METKSIAYGKAAKDRLPQLLAALRSSFRNIPFKTAKFREWVRARERPSVCVLHWEREKGSVGGCALASPAKPGAGPKGG